VNSRTLVGGEFSALTTANLVVPASTSDLRISEIHFNPADPTPSEIAAGFIDNDDFEFLELFNPNSTGSINLSGLQLANGISFTFDNVDLGPGERAVIVEDTFAFAERYGTDIRVLGQWSGGLSNSGESIDLLDSDLNEIFSVSYADNDPFYFATDGVGFSLVLDDPANTPISELGKYYSYRASTEFGGTPGEASADPTGVVINEVLTNSDGGQLDAIELFNPTSSAINVGGYFLSDAGDDLLQFQIPAGTIIAAGGFLVFDETDFNANPGFAGNFGLSGAGEELFLSRVAGGNLVSLEDSVEFDATFSGDSLGRLPDGTGRLQRLAGTSFGSANGDHAISSLIISEINYHPANPTSAALLIDPLLTDNDLEFIEITNTSSASINLTGSRIRGEADFDFAAGTSLAAGESIAVVSFDPADPLNANTLAAFLEHYGLSSATNLVGGLDGGLSNSFGRVALQQADFSQLGAPGVVVDEVVYDDLAPFANADGNGLSLQRVDATSNATFAASWIAELPTPGVSDLVAIVPQITSVIRDGGSIARPDLWSTFSVQFDTDVDLSVSALTIQNDTNGGVPVDLSGISFSYDATTFTATWNLDSLSNPLDAGFYTASLDGDLITGSVGGLAVDGNGDGSAGGSLATEVYQAIPGDANLDGTVTVLGDAFVLVSNLGSNVDTLWAQGDFNGDGVINVLGDAFILISNLGQSVVPTASFQFTQTINQPASQVVVASAVTEETAAKETEQSQPVVESKQLVLAGSQELDDAFASDDWII